MRFLNASDYTYILLSGFAGVWEAWCCNSGNDKLLAVALMLMGFPFAALTYAHQKFTFHGEVTVSAARSWRRLVVLWAGIPLSLFCGAWCAGATTALIYAIAHPTNFPGYIPLSVAYACAGLAWTCCIRIWLPPPDSPLFSKGTLGVYLIVMAGILVGLALTESISAAFHKDLFWQVEGILLTALSAGIIAVFSRRSHRPTPP